MNASSAANVVLHAAGDQIRISADVHVAAAHHGVTGNGAAGTGHMLILEPEWETAAEALADWMDALQ